MAACGPATKVAVCGATGELTYEIGDPHRALVLAGWNGGLGALIGLMQDAFENNHAGAIHLFHGVSDRDHLYLSGELRRLASNFPISTICRVSRTVPPLALTPTVAPGARSARMSRGCCQASKAPSCFCVAREAKFQPFNDKPISPARR